MFKIAKNIHYTPPKSTTLKLFEVTVHARTSPAHTVRTVTVLILAMGPESAEYNAVRELGMADPGGKLQVGVSEITGPFENGRVLSIKES